jgi:hypothetical protein
MADQIAIVIQKTRVQEGSGFVATAYFRNRSDASADTPSTVKYRLDCLTTGQQILDWTSVTAGESVSITVTGAQNAILNDDNDYEVKQLTVESDVGSADQCRGRKTWRVENIYGLMS